MGLNPACCCPFGTTAASAKTTVPRATKKTVEVVMWRSLSASVACLAVLAGSAAAADMPPAPAPYRAPVVAAPVYYNWSGFYIGGHGGGSWSDETSTSPFASALAPANFATTGK